MKAMLAVMRKELLTYFSSPLAYVILTAFLFVNGYFFSIIVAYLSQPGVPPGAPLKAFFGGSFFYWLFILLVVSALTMRLVSEERRSGTIEFLMTTPISDMEVILGKYFASLLYYIFLWSFTLIYVIIIHTHTPVELGPVFTGYLGIILHGALFLSAGIFASTFSKNQVVSAIWSFVILIFLFSVGLLVNLVPTQAWRDAVEYVTLWQQMDDFSKGIVDSRALVYSISLTVLFLFLSAQTLSVRKWR
ncbi:MAG TPA: ABC transporter permease subunit [Thermoanaerobaculia bacterium]|nr:ABC transporter permease subunit [Thermoanaerobaculia bacterium]HUM29883.1 ABC transporter permease subunit [Thermoanaerobaculia bacterium]HXK68250.1 ABC transporter permease subunit [Thermoanaerobaculia bacterium]